MLLLWMYDRSVAVRVRSALHLNSPFVKPSNLATAPRCLAVFSINLQSQQKSIANMEHALDSRLRQSATRSRKLAGWPNDKT
jgi:hypothetical protein